MKVLRRFTKRLIATMRGRRDDERVREELAEHLTLLTDEYVRAGMALGEAQRRAKLKIGALDATAETCRDEQRVRLFEDAWQDLRVAARSLRKRPAFALTAILTLALGIGANSAIFALVDATLLRPLPFRDPDRLVIVWEKTSRTMRGPTRIANLDEWQRRNHTFVQMAGIIPSVGSMVLAHADGTTDTISREWATGGFFDVLGVPAVAGRLFTAADDTAGRNIVVLSEALWRSRFNAAPDAIGRTLRLDGVPFTVVGVVPAGFRFVGEPEMWALDRRGGVTLVVGRMNADVSIEAATADMSSVASALAAEFPKTNEGRGAFIEPLREAAIDRDLRLTSWLFVAILVVALLMCCANVANLLLARGAARTREIAVRSALGAGRGRLARQLLTESGVLSIAGGVLGAGVGALILSLAPRVIPPGLLPATVTLDFDVRIVAFCGIAAVATGVLFGMAPVWQAATVSPAQATGESRTVVGGDGRARRLLMTAQVAAAVVLLFGAGLLLRTLMAVDGVDRGYRAGNVLTMIVDPPDGDYPTPEALERFYTEVGDAASALPGVKDVAWATTLPLGQSYEGQRPFSIVGAAPLEERDTPVADYQIVSATYFRTIDLPVVLGRAFNEHDTRTSSAVCLVNEALAARFFEDRSAVGARLQIGDTVREIVGVVHQVKHRPDDVEDLLQIYSPLSQNAPGDVFLLARSSSGPAAALAAPLRAVIGRLDTAHVVSVRDVKSLDDVVGEATSRQRFRAVLAGGFATLAAALAAIGLFGLVAYSTQQQLRDFGVRRALGATTSDIVKLVAGGALRIALGGAAAGLFLAAALTRTIDGLLFGVQPLDPATLGFVLVALTSIVVLATAGPARRAARVDPAITLRGE